MNVRSVSQPLITRPAYGQARTPVAESGLPGGGPSNRGLPLDSGIPGTSTFAKPVDDIRDFDKSTDTSPHRIDGPDDMLKDRDRIDVNEDNADKHDGIGEMGKGKSDTTMKTKAPYRDGLPHTHMASAELVAGLYLLKSASVLRITPNVKIATRPEEILSGLNPDFQERATQCSVMLKRADVGNLRWIFAVNCGNGSKVVKLKGFKTKANITKLSKMDLDLSCSCPAWRWLGPEHHAQREDYLDGRPVGTASVPVIKDPTGVNRVCKHVAAVLSFTKTWELPRTKLAETFTDESGQYYGDSGAGGIFYAKDTGRFCVSKRSKDVNEPGTWGTWGGAIDEDESHRKAVVREVKEESGYKGDYDLELVHIYKDDKFKFYNYLITVPKEFTPKHSWESVDHVWTTLDNLPSPLHFGLKELIPYLQKIPHTNDPPLS